MGRRPGCTRSADFPFGRRWSEWNGRYRDDVRRFWRGDAGLAGALASRLVRQFRPVPVRAAGCRGTRSTSSPATTASRCCDLVSYNQKHNEANGEENRDGSNENYSWNCGAEGETTDPEVLALRRRQAKNLMTTLMLSQGVPMLLAGDEFLRTQKGNNNAWCQDNEISWVNWELAEDERGLPAVHPRIDLAAEASSESAASAVLYGRVSPRADRAGQCPCGPRRSRWARSRPLARCGPRRRGFRA